MRRLAAALVLVLSLGAPAWAQITGSLAGSASGPSTAGQPTATPAAGPASNLPGSTSNLAISNSVIGSGVVQNTIATVAAGASGVGAGSGRGTSTGASAAAPAPSAGAAPSAGVQILCPADEPLIASEIAGTNLSCIP